jgi:hypothetical protein
VSLTGLLTGGPVQGMHEVLAVIIFALQQEKDAVPADHPLFYVVDPAFLEHDAFLLFEKVMLELQVSRLYRS